MEKKTIIDIVPKYDSLSQFHKIKDTDLFEMNNKVSSLLNILSFNEGMNGIFPTMGCYVKLQHIPYTENINEIIDAIRTSITQFIDFNIDINYEKDPRDEDAYNININVENLPGKLSFNITRNGSFVKLINPRYIR